jgi:transposase
MQTYGSIIPGGPTLARILPKAASEARDPPLSREMKRRLVVLNWHEAHGKRVSLTARHFGLSRSTVYDWLKRHARDGTRGLEQRTRRPHHVRQPTWSVELEQAVLKLRAEHPRWGKDKLVVLLRHEGLAASVSMVGRILRRLKDAGRLPPADLRDPLDRAPSSDSALRHQEAEGLRPKGARRPRPDRQR